MLHRLQMSRGTSRSPPPLSGFLEGVSLSPRLEFTGANRSQWDIFINQRSQLDLIMKPHNEDDD